MLIAMGIAAMLCIGIGLFPGVLYALLPYPVDFDPYTGAHVTGSLGILMFTLLGFVVFLRSLDPEQTVSLDTDWFYRKGARLFMWFAEKPVARWEGAVSALSDTVVLRVLHASARGGLLVDLNVVDAIVNGVGTDRSGLGRDLPASSDRGRDPLRRGHDRRRAGGHGRLCGGLGRLMGAEQP